MAGDLRIYQARTCVLPPHMEEVSILVCIVLKSTIQCSRGHQRGVRDRGTAQNSGRFYSKPGISRR